MANTSYTVNYDDQRFADVKSEEKQALTELEQTYGGMIDDSDKYYQAQIDASKQWAETQAANQQAQTDFAIEKIEQQKAQAKKDYTKEQSGAYVDWQKQSNQYGANAEAMAAQGMYGSGYSESLQVSMYNTYQNRVTAAREAYSLAVQNYNNSITEARLQNNSILAEIAYNSLQQQLELSLQGFQYKNQLLLQKASEKRAINSEYYSRYQDVLKQINTENALAEEVRQYNEKMAEEKRQYDQSYALQQRQVKLQKDQFAWQKEQAAKTSSSSGGGSSGGGGSSSKSGSNRVKVTKTNGSAKSASTNKSAIVTKSAGDTNTQSKTGTANTKSKNPPIDQQSVMDLGRGPLNGEQLSNLVAAGVIAMYVEDGKTKFKNVIAGGPTSKISYKGDHSLLNGGRPR